MEAGLNEAVAPLGTAIGEDQIRLLWTLAPEPVLCLDGDRAGGCIRSLENAFSLEGGLAVLFGNIAEAGCVIQHVQQAAAAFL